MTGTAFREVMLLAILAIKLADVAVEAGKGSSCPEWERHWSNYSRPGSSLGYDDEYEPLPNTTNLVTFCPPSYGVLIVRCTSDYDVMFQGTLWLDDYIATCNLTDGLHCLEFGTGCPDHAIQYGCDCDNYPDPKSQPTSSSSPANTSSLCSSNSGSQITAPPGNNCSCPTGSSMRQSAASMPGMTSWVMLMCLAVFTKRI